MSPESMRHLLRLVKMNHMRFVKLKVGTDDDLATLRLVRDELGDDVDIRGGCQLGLDALRGDRA